MEAELMAKQNIRNPNYVFNIKKYYNNHPHHYGLKNTKLSLPFSVEKEYGDNYSLITNIYDKKRILDLKGNLIIRPEKDMYLSRPNKKIKYQQYDL